MMHFWLLKGWPQTTNYSSSGMQAHIQNRKEVSFFCSTKMQQARDNAHR